MQHCRQNSRGSMAICQETSFSRLTSRRLMSGTDPDPWHHFFFRSFPRAAALGGLDAVRAFAGAAFFPAESVSLTAIFRLSFAAVPGGAGDSLRTIFSALAGTAAFAFLSDFLGEVTGAFGEATAVFVAGAGFEAAGLGGAAVTTGRTTFRFVGD